MIINIPIIEDTHDPCFGGTLEIKGDDHSIYLKIYDSDRTIIVKRKYLERALKATGGSDD